MSRRFVELNGQRWEVVASGRSTQYTKDEFGVMFTRIEGGPTERRLARYSPVGSKSRELSLAELSDANLRDLMARSQPAWTAPETGYRR